MKRTTIKDLAQQIGVNPSTISRALKDHPDISPALRAEVKSLAEKLHYRPNNMAIHLRQRSSKLIGLVIPEGTMFFYPSVIKAIENVLHETGYSLLMLHSNESLEREIENVQICFDNDVAGLLIAFTRETENADHLALIHDAGVPIVMFDKILDGAAIDCIKMDDFSDAIFAVEHLVKTGCRRIAGIFGNQNMPITRRRLEGFTTALKKHKFPIIADHLLFANNPAEALDCALSLIQTDAPPDGIFAISDEIITGAIPVLSDLGLKIPGEISLICMSDGVLPFYLRPKVSFLRHDGNLIGRLAAERLCDLIKSGEHLGDFFVPKTITLKSEFVELDTTRKLEKELSV